MNFTSYAKDFHDVTLWRALGQVAAGSYIDAVSGGSDNAWLGRAFDDHGWRGVRLVDAAGPALMPAGPTLLAARLGRGTPGQQDPVPRVSLDMVFDACPAGPVHWLHLDATGLDDGVLDGWRRSAIRPWIIVVSSARTTPSAWHAGLVSKGYVLGGRTTDTLFYVLQQPATPGVLLAHLPQGAWHTGALQHAVRSAEQRMAQAERRAALAEGRAEALQQEVVAALVHARHHAELQNHLQAVFASTSWQVTKPLRWVARLKRSPRSAMGELLAKCTASGPGTAKALLRPDCPPSGTGPAPAGPSLSRRGSGPGTGHHNRTCLVGRGQRAGTPLPHPDTGRSGAFFAVTNATRRRLRCA
jgi:hypothetical protein